MKEIRETKMVEQTTVKFVAKDGTEFDDEDKCERYERQLDTDRVEKEFAKLNIKNIYFPFSDYFIGEPVEMFFVTLNDKKDFNILDDYIEIKYAIPYFDNYISAYANELTYPCTKLVGIREDVYAEFVDRDFNKILNEIEKCKNVVKQFTDNKNTDNKNNE